MSELKTLQINAAHLSALSELKQRRLRREVAEKSKQLLSQKQIRRTLEATLLQAEASMQQANTNFESLLVAKAEVLQNLQQEKTRCALWVQQAKQAARDQLVLESEAHEALQSVTQLWLRAQQRDENITEHTDRKIGECRKRQAHVLQYEMDDNHAMSERRHG